MGEQSDYTFFSHEVIRKDLLKEQKTLGSEGANHTNICPMQGKQMGRPPERDCAGPIRGAVRRLV